jgi:hypothetical protein
MIRPVFTEVSPFLAPFIAYAIYLWITKTSVMERSSWPPKTLASLGIVALLLMIGSFIYLSHFSGAAPGVDYIPAHFDKDGTFVPGQFK